MTKTLLTFVLAATCMSSVVACSSSDDDSTPVSDGTSVDVALSEFTITVSKSSVKAGDVTFNIENTGGDVHEFVVVKSDLAPADLPTNADGSFDEEATGIEAVDEIEDIAAGGTGKLSVTVDAGHYYLVCNIVDAAGSHFHEGMYAEVTVE